MTISSEISDFLGELKRDTADSSGDPREFAYDFSTATKIPCVASGLNRGIQVEVGGFTYALQFSLIVDRADLGSTVLAENHIVWMEGHRYRIASVNDDPVLAYVRVDLIDPGAER